MSQPPELLELLRCAALPPERAQAMPPGVYASREVLALEIDHIFRTEWLCVGREHDIPGAGDYFAVDVAGEPLIVLRDGDGAVRAHANVCRHRMACLVEGEGNLARIVCPYHAWTYGLDGLLMAAPFMGDDFEMNGCRLHAYRVECWQGWVFVALDDGAASLAARLENLSNRFAGYRMAEYWPVFRVHETWDGNWKMLIENFTEGYHLFQVHSETVEPALPTRLVQCVPGEEAFSLFVQTRVEGVPYESARPLAACSPALTDEERRSYPIFCIYPGHLVSLSPDRLFWMSVQPMGTDRIDVRWGVDAFPGAIPDGLDGETYRGELRAAFEAINDEDKRILRGLRRSVESGAARPGPLAPQERGLWEFTRYLAGRLGGARGGDDLSP